MRSQVSLVRVAAASLVGLLVLGASYLILTGSLSNSFAAAKGIAAAKWDMSRGRWVMHVPARHSRSNLVTATRWSRVAGVLTRVEYYRCFGSAPCESYYEAYDTQVRNSINRRFGYDIFAEDFRRSDITILIKHE